MKTLHRLVRTEPKQTTNSPSVFSVVVGGRGSSLILQQRGDNETRGEARSAPTSSDKNRDSGEYPIQTQTRKWTDHREDKYSHASGRSSKDEGSKTSTPGRPLPDERRHKQVSQEPSRNCSSSLRNRCSPNVVFREGRFGRDRYERDHPVRERHMDRKELSPSSKASSSGCKKDGQGERLPSERRSLFPHKNGWRKRKST